jgi:hypothetical protein
MSVIVTVFMELLRLVKHLLKRLVPQLPAVSNIPFFERRGEIEKRKILGYENV